MSIAAAGYANLLTKCTVGLAEYQHRPGRIPANGECMDPRRAPNQRALEAFLRYSFEQGLAQSLSPAGLFARETPEDFVT
jgi:hypothetical protein